MACYRPIPASQDRPGGSVTLWPSGYTPKTEHAPAGHGTNTNLWLPCGQCIGCKTARANQWAQRCQHEATQWKDTIFLTLTYDDKYLPYNGYLEAHHLAAFIKRLRKSLNSRHSRVESDQGIIRYFACGEYGTRNGRPHYHAILFNCNFSDRTRVRDDKQGGPQYNSDTVQRLWHYGRHEFGVARPAAANYVAQYSLKQQRTAYFQTRKRGYQDLGYWIPEEVDLETGELLKEAQYVPKPAPFLRMSLKPGIGATWLSKYATDLQHGYLVNNGRKFAIPRTYRERLKLHNPQIAEAIDMATIKHRRGLDPEQHNNDDRRKAAEQIHEARIKLTHHRQ